MAKKAGGNGKLHLLDDAYRFLQRLHVTDSILSSSKISANNYCAVNGPAQAKRGRKTAGQYRMSVTTTTTFLAIPQITQVRGQPSVPFTSVVNYEPNVPIVHAPTLYPALLLLSTLIRNLVLFFTAILLLRLRISSQSRFFIELLLVLPIHVWVFKLFINHLLFRRWRCCRKFLPHHSHHFYKSHRPPPDHVLLRRQSHAKKLIVQTTAHGRAGAKPALCQNVGLSSAQRMTGKKRRKNETKETEKKKE
ncbi:hypothetical protein niasHT_031501 [Heterodera trifolii]|uniref:Uncharacterized protein n=1 Tax=Heterodera trifolii TaxID=157864 RepID=A0ABD2I750_9BILA